MNRNRIAGRNIQDRMISLTTAPICRRRSTPRKKAEEHKQEMEEKEPIDNKKEKPIEENWPEPEINQKEDTAKKNPVFLGSSYGSAVEC